MISLRMDGQRHGRAKPRAWRSDSAFPSPAGARNRHGGSNDTTGLFTLGINLSGFREWNLHSEKRRVNRNIEIPETSNSLPE
jgi:hypothetical protein